MSPEKECLNCSSKCGICSNEETCLFCKPGTGRTLDAESGCGCQNGYYDDGISENC